MIALLRRVAAGGRAGIARVVGSPRVRRVARIAGRVAVVLLVLLVLLRVALPLVLPWALARAAASVGLACTYERLDLSVLAGEVELSHLVVAPIEGGDPIVRLAHLRADVDVLSLLGDRPRIYRLEVDGLDLDVVREADGRLAIVKRIERHRKPGPPPEPEPEEEPEERAPDDRRRAIDLPVAVDS